MTVYQGLKSLCASVTIFYPLLGFFSFAIFFYFWTTNGPQDLMTSSSNAVTLETASGVAVIWGYDGIRGEWSTHMAAICWCWLEVSLPIFVALQLCALMIWRLTSSCREVQKFKKEAPGWFVCVLPGLESCMLQTKTLPILSWSYISYPVHRVSINLTKFYFICYLSNV